MPLADSGEWREGLEFMGTFSLYCIYTSMLVEELSKENVVMHYFVYLKNTKLTKRMNKS